MYEKRGLNSEFELLFSQLYTSENTICFYSSLSFAVDLLHFARSFYFDRYHQSFFITFHFFSRLRRVLIYRLFQSYIGWLFGTNLDVMTYRSHKVWNFNLYSKQLNESCIKNGNLFDFWIQKMSPNGIPVPPVVLERTPTRGEIVPVEVLTVHRTIF